MKVLVCGDRNWTNRKLILERLKQLEGEIIIVEGGARGADSLAGSVAKELGYGLRIYPAQWTTHGKAAGPIRNRQMLDTEHPDLVIAFHNNLEASKGTKDMVNYAKKHNIPTEVISETPTH